MEIIRIVRIIQDTMIRQKMHGKSIGFVPTMGALHEGHLSLVRVCKEENDLCVVSIFVNPIQFGPKEDYQRYPRDIEGDMEKLRGFDVDIVFLPDVQAMYPEGFSTTVDIGGLSEKLCGKWRPKHFQGVATVVTKLFNIISPTRAYFGQKDYQQSLIIKKLIKDLNMPIEITVYPTLREEDGLAMSSRNQHLSLEERKSASIIYTCLLKAEEKVRSQRPVKEVKSLMIDTLSSEPLITEVQYAGLYDPLTLDEINDIKGSVLLAVAVKIGDVRLIDNILIGGS